MRQRPKPPYPAHYVGAKNIRGNPLEFSEKRIHIGMIFHYLYSMPVIDMKHGSAWSTITVVKDSQGVLLCARGKARHASRFK